MLINLSNHPSAKWSDAQLRSAKEQFGGRIVDIPFPQVAPDGDEAYIERLAGQVCSGIVEMENIDAVHVMGEMTLTLAIVHRLSSSGFSCVASTTQRVVRELPFGQSESTFSFVRFRKYTI